MYRDLIEEKHHLTRSKFCVLPRPGAKISRDVHFFRYTACDLKKKNTHAARILKVNFGEKNTQVGYDRIFVVPNRGKTSESPSGAETNDFPQATSRDHHVCAFTDRNQKQPHVFRITTTHAYTARKLEISYLIKRTPPYIE